jgi:4-diphosphocytidyl-2-C-methyl-D-erythritol kinase
MRAPSSGGSGAAPLLGVECLPKVNLYLRVVRRREDGYHELETVFQSIGGGDRLTAAPASTLTLRCSDPELPTDSRNLVLRAAELLQERHRLEPGSGAELRLLKRVPAGGGLGGGSADGAAALVLLARLWGLPVAPSELFAAAAELGSDVPFFLHGGTVLARGRGELLAPVPVSAGAPRLWLVLVRPPVGVSTPWAYGRWRPQSGAGGPPIEELLAPLRSGDAAGVARAVRNDLEPGVAAEVPEVAAARAWLLAGGALGARMTGSGSVVFGVARDEEHARELAARAGAPGRVWAVPCLTAGEAAIRPAPCAQPALPDR